MRMGKPYTSFPAITNTSERSIAKIALQIEAEGRTNNFIGNGTYQIHQAR
jgi:hypothetical protein